VGGDVFAALGSVGLGWENCVGVGGRELTMHG